MINGKSTIEILKLQILISTNLEVVIVVIHMLMLMIKLKNVLLIFHLEIPR